MVLLPNARNGRLHSCCIKLALHNLQQQLILTKLIFDRITSWSVDFSTQRERRNAVLNQYTILFSSMIDLVAFHKCNGACLPV
jgi:hypothetical protein